MGDIGVYALGSARFVTGAEPEAVDHAHVVRENGVDVTARIAARFPGVPLFRHGLHAGVFPRQYVAFHGEEGVLTLTCPFKRGCLRSGGAAAGTRGRAGGDRTLARGEPVCAAGGGIRPVGARRRAL